MKPPACRDALITEAIASEEGMAGMEEELVNLEGRSAGCRKAGTGWRENPAAFCRAGL